MKLFNRDHCPGGRFTIATMSHITIQEMHFLNETYGDVLVVEGGIFGILGAYERGAEYEGGH